FPCGLCVFAGDIPILFGCGSAALGHVVVADFISYFRKASRFPFPPKDGSVRSLVADSGDDGLGTKRTLISDSSTLLKSYLGILRPFDSAQGRLSSEPALGSIEGTNGGSDITADLIALGALGFSDSISVAIWRTMVQMRAPDHLSGLPTRSCSAVAYA